MKVVNKKVRKYYLTVLSMCGEMMSLHAPAHAPLAESTAGDELRLMMRDNLIRYHKHMDRKRTFRICDPAGLDAIESIDHRLLEHTEMLIGKRNARYTGSREYRLKKRKEAALMFALSQEGFTVDGIVQEADKTFSICSPTLLDAETIMRLAPREAPLFLSGSLLRKKDTGVSHQRREMSISPGTIFSTGGIYTTFVISTARFRWNSASETASAGDISRLYRDALDMERHTDGRHRGIFYADNLAVAEDLISTTTAGVKRMDPTSIFKLSYIVPLDDINHAMDITKMLTVPSWRALANEVLDLNQTKRSDGQTEGGRNIHNLLCCNAGRIREVEPDVKRNGSRLIIHDWQKPILERLYDTEIDALELSDKHFHGLLLAVQRKYEESLV